MQLDMLLVIGRAGNMLLDHPDKEYIFEAGRLIESIRFNAFRANTSIFKDRLVLFDESQETVITLRTLNKTNFGNSKRIVQALDALSSKLRDFGSLKSDAVDYLDEIYPLLMLLQSTHGGFSTNAI
jgi:hypothetical protein